MKSNTIRLHLLAILALTGCARHAPTPPPNAPKVLRVSQRNEPDDLDPAGAALPDDFFIIRALSEGLVVPSPTGGDPLPAAAEQWEVSPDGLTWTFHLRADARWSNGDPVTADDFADSLRRVLTPATAAPKADLLFAIKNARAFAAGQLADFDAVGVRATDAHTLLITLERPTPQFLAYVASGPWIPVNPGVVARLGRAWTLPGNYVGNGSFILTEWQPGQRIVVRKNPLYHGAAGIRLDEIQFLRFDDNDTEERAFRAGEVDVTMTVPFTKLGPYARDHPDELHRAPLAETRYLAFNTGRPPLNDPRVRRALSLAINRDDIVEFVVQGGRRVAEQLVPPELGYGSQSPATPAANHRADVALARRLLSDAGFPSGRGFPRLELSGWTNTPALEAIQAMWKKDLGVDVAIVSREARAHVAALQAGNYDIGFITLIPDVADPFSVLDRFTTGAPENYPHWADARYDALVAEGEFSADPARRAGLLRAAEARIAELCPLAPLYFNARTWLMRPSVHGWQEDELWTRNYSNLWLSPASAAGSSTAETQPRQILRLGNGAEPQDLDPQAITGVPEHRIIMGLFEGLVTEDPHDLHPVPGLAESWDTSPDGRIYTFHLRANLRWSDGAAITADDFVQSYKRMLTPAFAAEYAYLIYNFVAGADEYYHGKLTDFSRVGIKALDDRTLRVTLKNPTPFLLKIIACGVAWDAVPVKVIARYGPLDRRGNDWTHAGNLVGSGPFLLKEWRLGQKVVIARNPSYWDASHVKLDEIEFYPIDDLPAEERMFRTGQIDATYELPQDKIDVYRQEYPDELHIDPWLGIYYYRCNVTRPPLDDKRVRKALALAIDRETLVRDVVRGDSLPAYAVSYPGTAGYTPRARLTGGVPEARRLLAEAGFPGGRGFPVLELLYNTQLNHRRIAETIQQMWRKNLGIDIRLRNEEWKVYLDSQHTQNFDLERAGWIADYVDPHVFLEIWETGNGNNDTLWSNAAYDRLVHAALAAKDDRERYEIYQGMDAILVDECPVIPIYYYTRIYALNPKVKGWWPTLIDDHPWKYVYLEN